MSPAARATKGCLVLGCGPNVSSLGKGGVGVGAGCGFASPSTRPVDEWNRVNKCFLGFGRCS